MRCLHQLRQPIAKDTTGECFLVCNHTEKRVARGDQHNGSKRAFFVTLLFSIVAASTPTLIAAPTSEVRDDFERAVDEYQQAYDLQSSEPVQARQLFRSAAQRFESIISSGVTNGHLEYNLGNCHLQAGDVGRAILHYRRAQRLSPRDKMLAENLAEARSRCVTNIELSRRSAVLRNLFFWHYDTSVSERTRIAIVCYVGFWMVLMLRNLMQRRAIIVTSIVLAFCTLSLGASLATSQWSDRNKAPGVITSLDVIVRKGPSPSYSRQFEQPLQPGVEFTIHEKRGSWWRIDLPDGNTGWIESTNAETIPNKTRTFLIESA